MRKEGIITNRENIIRKLTSRKLWLAVADFTGMLLIALNVAEETVTQVTALIMAGAGAVAYIIAEGFADTGEHSRISADDT